MNKIFKKCWLAFAIIVISIAILSSLFRALTPWASAYKEEVENHLSLALGQKVSIKTIETGWHWFTPVLKLESVSILDPSKPPINLDRILVGLNIWRSLWNWQLQPGVLYIEEVHLVLREKEGNWNLDGFAENKEAVNKVPSELGKQLLFFLSQQDKLVLKQVSADIYPAKGEALHVNDINVVFQRNGNHYKIRGKSSLLQGEIADSKPTDLKLMANFDFNPSKLNRTKGSAYLSANNIQTQLWQSFFPQTKEYFQEGEGDAEIWIDIAKGKLEAIQSKIDFSNLLVKNQIVESLKANLSFKPEEEGWVLKSDAVLLTIDGIEWPENKVLIKQNLQEKSYFIYMQNLDLGLLMSTHFEWPDSIKPLEDIKLRGKLNALQFSLKGKDELYFLTRFDKLGFELPKNKLKVDNLSGVLEYQPYEGRLELDGIGSTIQLPPYPSQRFSILNTALDWKSWGPDTYRISIDRMELSKPNFALSLLGLLDYKPPFNFGYLRLQGDYSARNAENLIDYLPAQYLKPAFYKWLKSNVKRVATINGKMTLNGDLKSFPFDQNEGEFTLSANINGLDLHPQVNWPLFKDIDTKIVLDKRNLNMNISHMDFNGAPVENVHLQVDDMGKGKESLNIRGKATLPLENLTDFVKRSPLFTKLPYLKKLVMDGTTTLSLYLSFPLYPESDDVTVQGTLDFDKNNLIIKHRLGDLTLNKVNGNLYFNQDGIMESILYANLWDAPLDINLVSKKRPKPHTQIIINAEAVNVDSIKQKVNASFLPLINGEFSAKTTLIVSDKTSDVESMQIKTNLQGLALNLPKPLGKTVQAIMPLTVDMVFKTANLLNVKANYANTLRTDLLFNLAKKDANFKSGVIRLGTSHAAIENAEGLQIVGTVAHFDLEEWQKALSIVPGANNSEAWFEILRNVDLYFGKLVAFKRSISDIALKIRPAKNGAWGFKIKQADIQGDLTYDAKQNNLEGYFTLLRLSKSEIEPKRLEFKPGDLPNLNLRIDGLEYNNFKVGDLTLNAKSNASNFEIKYCKIQTPNYTVNLEGNWRYEQNKHKTELDGNLKFKNLAKTLDQWSISPVVDASKGEVYFQGGWPAPLYDFAINRVRGKTTIVLKNGRITDLSPEMEQKLGLGKLLSILSLQTLPRRLTLDFSDLAYKGYSFDIFKGNFAVKNGVMHTEDSYIDGPVAYAGMKGDLDLSKKLYDLELNIAPHITASLPVVATIAGGPIAGIAAWVAGKIINQGMQNISGYSYKISGPWQEPIVQQVNIIKQNKPRD